MLKILVDDESCTIEANGTMETVMVQLSIALSDIYKAYRKEDPVCGLIFRTMLTKVVTDEKSPVWT